MQHPLCLVNGNHMPGSEWEQECPFRIARVRSESARRAAATRRQRLEGAGEPGTSSPGRVVAGGSGTGTSRAKISTTSSTIFRDGRAFQPGRPRVEITGHRRKARDRARAYRARRRQHLQPA